MATFSDSGELIGVYPFSATERDYLIRVNGHTVYAMCALDALAIAPLFNMVTQIISHCNVTGNKIDIQMTGNKVSNIDETRGIYMGVAWNGANTNACCADSLCKEIVFLRDEKTARQWLADKAIDGELFTLAEAVQFANRFFVPLMH
jgi:mercuric reductase